MAEFDRCAIGTMAWGSNTYGKIIQGSNVDEQTLIDTLAKAKETGLVLIDTAYKYGLGYSENLIGNYGDESLIISTKFTPGNRKKAGSLTRAFAKDLEILHREYIDIYWLHLPIKIEQNLTEIVELVKQGKIKNVGISNFTMQEAKMAKDFLHNNGIELYGVQNHYSLISRDWEQNGLIKWCKDNQVKFYGWSIMEQGALTGKTHYRSLSLRGLLYNKKLMKLKPLFTVLSQVGRAHSLSTAQVNIAWALSKGIVPICGCRKPYQVEELKNASEIVLSSEEILLLEEAAEKTGVHTKGDVFRKMLAFV